MDRIELLIAERVEEPGRAPNARRRLFIFPIIGLVTRATIKHSPCLFQ